MKRVLFCIVAVFFFNNNLLAVRFLPNDQDTVRIDSVRKKADLFYENLSNRAHRHRFTGFLYDVMLPHPEEDEDGAELTSYEYYKQFNGKTIASIRIQPLEVFGPTFNDTTRVAKTKLEHFANSIHTKSNLNALRRNLWIKEGMEFDANLLMDNERFLRNLPYLKDVRMIINTRVDNDRLVDILVLTKDVFAFGVTGRIDEINAGELGIYDQNVFGIGHEISATFVGHTSREPYMGLETYYIINNLGGKFVDTEVGYINTYKRHGYLFDVSKEFLKSESTWGGGFDYSRYFRTDRINSNDPVTTDYDLDFHWFDLWYGRNMQLGTRKNNNRSQMTLSGRVRYLHFNDRPLPDDDDKQYFSNSIFYMGSLSFSKRRYIHDRLIYSYGITEDIPKGYLHELVVGYDDDEFIKRWYSHLYFSSGNIVKYKPYYFFASASIGGYFNKSRFEQGMAEGKIDYISRLFDVGTTRLRQFVKMDYMVGIRRYDIENLTLSEDIGIRGFSSSKASGKQRLVLNLESVFFQRNEFLRFNTAFFSFLDLGIIGSNTKVLFTQNYYTGLGIGLRLRNENLVFKTIQIRLAFYPYHPSDKGFLGFILEEQLRTHFYSFQPGKPELLDFE